MKSNRWILWINSRHCARIPPTKPLQFWWVHLGTNLAKLWRVWRSSRLPSTSKFFYALQTAKKAKKLSNILTLRWCRLWSSCSHTSRIMRWSLRPPLKPFQPKLKNSTHSWKNYLSTNVNWPSETSKVLSLLPLAWCLSRALLISPSANSQDAWSKL